MNAICATRLAGAVTLAGALVFSGCSRAPSLVPSSASSPSGQRAAFASNSSQTACEQHAVQNAAQLVACIRQAALWQRLSQFQEIADDNPVDGHPSRDTGTPGYLASVNHVASLMRSAGYHVTIQRYMYHALVPTGSPVLGTAAAEYGFDRDWFAARGSAPGRVSAPVQPPAGDGCADRDFARFERGNVALMQRGSCSLSTQVENAQRAGAAAAIVYAAPDGAPYEGRLSQPAAIPVAGVATYSLGADLLAQYRSGKAPRVHLALAMKSRSGPDYNVIADSPYGDPNRVVVVDAHLDSIYGAGMLDNASGSTTALEVALNIAKTPTHNHLRFIWFGGEELGLFGSIYYVFHLPQDQLKRIIFDEDVDVTATPNFDILIADPRFAGDVHYFPPNVVPESKPGNDYFADFFSRDGVVSRPAWFGNDGTDSNSFSLGGVPNTGILTNQDCCKRPFELALWGGFRGNYEGKIPSFDGGCVDMPRRWCDNLSNNDPFVLELASKAVAYVTYELANDPTLDH